MASVELTRGHACAMPLLLMLLTACNGGGDSFTPMATYTVGGTVTGLGGTGLVLQNNGGSSLPVSSAGAFTFVGGLSSGAAYSVTVATQPSSPTRLVLSTTAPAR